MYYFETFPRSSLTSVFFNRGRILKIIAYTLLSTRVDDQLLAILTAGVAKTLSLNRKHYIEGISGRESRSGGDDDDDGDDDNIEFKLELETIVGFLYYMISYAQGCGSLTWRLRQI